MSRQIIISVSSIQGQANIAVIADGIKQDFEFNWKRLPNEDEGFMTNFHPRLIRLTPVSAQLFLTTFMEVIQKAAEVTEDDITILNDRGEQVAEVQFLPPTFVSGAEDISDLVGCQEMLERFHDVYEQSGRRTTRELIEACVSEGILDDFLCILESKITGIRFNLDCLTESDEE